MQSNGVSIISLSEKIGLAKSTLSKIINGHTSKPDYKTIDSICLHLGIDRSDIITYEDLEYTDQAFDVEKLRENLLDLMRSHQILSSHELSVKSGVAQNGIERILNGVNKSKPYSKTLYGIANYFGLTVSQLKGLDEIPPTRKKDEADRFLFINSSELNILSKPRFPAHPRNHTPPMHAKFMAIHIDGDAYFPHFKKGATAIVDCSEKAQENDYLVAIACGTEADFFILKNGNLFSISNSNTFKLDSVEIIGKVVELKLSSL
ncbi:helix-turn-helix domain-containing protein [Chromobacterium sp. IIBBL 290-4]|uniref:helix-turn-helix domain-containing protein n=1 Tax=Chromobacterium sp. IIBBL 290-4 TaxID=2953890 RepID=UPI0020B80B5A|nr:helix-turn-helix domain-containing protein [Chromobacterium sp. IIBBL 290-4]UTH74160.1 helix-turn-helix domain-containing protein [Chromobacterium sp. IIBBL 290-4]